MVFKLLFEFHTGHNHNRNIYLDQYKELNQSFSYTFGLPKIGHVFFFSICLLNNSSILYVLGNTLFSIFLINIKTPGLVVGVHNLANDYYYINIKYYSKYFKLNI